MEQDRQPRNKPYVKGAKIVNGEKTVSSINGAGETRQLHVKHETRTLFNTIHKNKLKIDQRPKCKMGYYKTLRGKHKQNTLT